MDAISQQLQQYLGDNSRNLDGAKVGTPLHGDTKQTDQTKAGLIANVDQLLSLGDMLDPELQRILRQVKTQQENCALANLQSLPAMRYNGPTSSSDQSDRIGGQNVSQAKGSGDQKVESVNAMIKN